MMIGLNHEEIPHLFSPKINEDSPREASAMQTESLDI